MEKQRKAKQFVKCMLETYCRKKHEQRSLCPKCQTLLGNTVRRIDRYPYMKTKTFCCCYEAKRRQGIERVMRFSGQRTMLYQPILVIKHRYLSK